MPRPFSLSGRNLEILHAVVRNYIASGEPVGSRTISTRRKDSLSSASIRNVMADLEEQGYLTHPHTSAGRVPTDKALRHYVQALGTPRLRPSEVDFVEGNLGQATSLEERMGRSSHVLATLTQQVAVVMLASISEAVIQHVQFVRLSERRILVVLVARGDMVRHRIIRTAEAIGSEELERLANFVNQNFVGWKLSDARTEILRLIREERAAFDLILRRLRLLCLHGFLAPDSDIPLYLEGTPHLVEGLQNLDGDRVRELLQALEDKAKLIELLDQCIRGEMKVCVHSGSSGEAVSVRIGLEDALPAMKGFALIGTMCDMQPGVEGRIAVIGPTRMQYERVISAVAHVARMFQNFA